ncbi:hypothetical protein FOA52_008704 [Chlamydomonas sp. UWO 241]|nr:hypothetical protein FOA52_008704 [Chlamydomonas sp. UWO 241]
MGKVQFGCASEHVTEVDEKEADSRTVAGVIPGDQRDGGAREGDEHAGGADGGDERVGCKSDRDDAEQQEGYHTWEQVITGLIVGAVFGIMWFWALDRLAPMYAWLAGGTLGATFQLKDTWNLAEPLRVERNAVLPANRYRGAYVNNSTGNSPWGSPMKKMC